MPSSAGGGGTSPIEVDESSLEPRLASTAAGSCAVSAGQVVCWGGDQRGPWPYPELPARSVAGRGSGVCTLGPSGEGKCFLEPWYYVREDGSIAESPGNTVRELPNPQDYIAVRTGLGGDFLGLDAEGRLRALGGLDAPDEALMDVASVFGGGCGIRKSDRTLFCWARDLIEGDSCLDAFAEAIPPSGRFVQIVAGSAHFCALSEQGQVACWNPYATFDDCDLGQDYGQASAPAGRFRYLSAGEYHSCGVREDGGISCWGAGTVAGACSEALDCGMSVPPPDTDFVQVAAGYTHTCGLKANDKVVCWGSNTFDRSTPPPELRP